MLIVYCSHDDEHGIEEFHYNQLLALVCDPGTPCFGNSPLWGSLVPHPPDITPRSRKFQQHHPFHIFEPIHQEFCARKFFFLRGFHHRSPCQTWHPAQLHGLLGEALVVLVSVLGTPSTNEKASQPVLTLVLLVARPTSNCSKQYYGRMHRVTALRALSMWAP